MNFFDIEIVGALWRAVDVPPRRSWSTFPVDHRHIEAVRFRAQHRQQRYQTAKHDDDPQTYAGKEVAFFIFLVVEEAPSRFDYIRLESKSSRIL